MNIYFQKSFQRAFGTWPLQGEDLTGPLNHALEVGYRAIDTAQMYGNEADTGRILAASGIDRGELCVTTKVHPKNYGEADFIPSVERSLDDLGMESVDVLLLHWPPEGGDIVPPLKRLEEAAQRGLARNIGVSNFNGAMLRQAVQTIATPLVTNQVEFHPLLNQDVLLAAAAETGIPLSAYCSVARGAVFREPDLARIAEGYGKSVGQITLRWILQKGVSVNTMSTNPANIAANFDIMDFTLSSVDMARIDSLTRKNDRIVTSDVVPYAPEWD